MKLLLDSFWRAGAYCLHPKVVGLSLLPLAVGAAIALLLGWFYWEAAVAGVRGLLEHWLLVDAALKWVEGVAGASFRSVLAPLLVVLVAAPAVVVMSVLLVALLMVPAIVDLVATRRFPALEKKRGAGFFGSLFWSLGCTVLALVGLAASLPLWFVPPLVLVLPPVIWGWLTYRVMSFDTLAVHASPEERRALLQEHRMPLWGIGIVSGFLGAAPSLLWAFGAVALIFAPFVIALSVWLYTLVFAFSALWFAHYLLAALARRRAVADAEAAVQPAGTPLPAGTVDITPAPPAAPLPPPTAFPPSP
jgi:hypothetical protein